ncbi:hypothetical protein EJ02DRAFT_228658 [Clathrospora elynae]|uniref:WSC domain-containing protein n=1 Tax=Clathrospora elynae TaxID=706981 RepID=A0A6A5SKX0_9PLEO|nr:hypothetical protein EJ02DRAFT_228658 [Clathrospora elynae]
MSRRLGSTLVCVAAIFTLFSLILPTMAASWKQSYCSNQNTGSNTDVYEWPWQSNGNCTGHCNQQGSYAFAVIQYTDCWCSDYIPADQEDISKCQVNCPGFPDEKCGNRDDDLYIYIQMDGKPSGTQGGSQPTTSAAVSSAAPSPTEASSSPFTSGPPSTTLQTSATPTTPMTTDEPMTVPTVVTESGVIVTRTVVISPTPAPAKTESPQKKSNTGAIAGGVAGGILGLLAIAGALLFVLWRRKKQRSQEDGHNDGSSGITRNVSTMSRAGLLGGGREKQSPTPLVTNFGSQRSRPDGDSISPMTPSTRRLSQPILVDSRLNPNAVLTFHGANQSRESLTSIDDSRDYGRQLNVRNPDPN